MSYSAEICFKTVRAEDVYNFLIKYKKHLQKKLDSIAEDEFIFMPSIRWEHRYKGIDDEIVSSVDTAWAKTALFTNRYFYLPEYDLLGVFGVTKSAQDIFDGKYYFQNSCDQDYKLSYWKGVKIFEDIASKWSHATEAEIEEGYMKRWGETWDEEDADYEYHRRELAYDEIWSLCSKYLFEESEVCYFAAFNSLYENYRVRIFTELCKKKYEEWLKNTAEKAENSAK